jgi:hypothetical protein
LKKIKQLIKVELLDTEDKEVLALNLWWKIVKCAKGDDNHNQCEAFVKEFHRITDKATYVISVEIYRMTCNGLESVKVEGDCIGVSIARL